ncbi:YdgA family protein [Idiomarina aminovorans]|uniref:YdgA family protein n=1 Tax=Idiomarina aminovorans TaxID=2914829 RepID=UPI002005E060|nr:YdgA family protein [Idiomarina sp. ATCH4]MCK7459555.1 YdgA family protein [Idiomarina sp. ATCH4]
MNKKGLLGGVGIVIVAAALIAPKFVAPQVEDTLKQHVEVINALPAYKASVVSFDSGWFSSSATISLGADFGSLHPDASVPDDVSVEVVVNVQHGPVLMRFAPGLGMASFEAFANDDGLREYLDWEENTPFYHLTGSAGFSGGISYNDSIVPFSFKSDEEQTELTTLSYEGEGEISLDEFSYEGELEGAEVLLSDQSISIGKLKLETEAKGDILEIMKGELYEGDMSIKLNEIIAYQPDDVELFKLKDFGLEFVNYFSDDKKRMNIDMNYSVDSLEAEDFDLEDLKLKMAFHNIDSEFLFAYNQMVKQVYDQNPDEIEVATQKLVKENLPQLLQAEPEFVISEFSGEMEPGNFKGNLSAKLVGISQLPDNIENIDFWLSSLIVDSSIAIDKPLLKWIAEQQMLSTLRIQKPGADEAELQEMAEQQAPTMINMYLEQGLLQEEDDVYRSEFLMEDGWGVLNGYRMPLTKMM